MEAQITEVKGDLFEMPEDSVLIHSCNCRGVWGAGIALEFKKRYPKALSVYRVQCLDMESGERPGHCILIEPQETDSRKHWIACLLTSHGWGTLPEVPWTETENVLRQIPGLILTIVEHETPVVKASPNESRYDIMKIAEITQEAVKRRLPSTWRMMMSKLILEANGQDGSLCVERDKWPSYLTTEELYREVSRRGIVLPTRSNSKNHRRLMKLELKDLLIEDDTRNDKNATEEGPSTERPTKRLRTE
ncbi:MAG: hypothetical protein M1812_002155 [Candelaria pacifica]|nr:MAG: hypothetical protein M1812_002155 [Candelaria pacifica]